MLTRVRAEVPGTVAGQLLVDLDALDVDGWLLQGAAACAAALPDLPSGLTRTRHHRKRLCRRGRTLRPQNAGNGRRRARPPQVCRQGAQWLDAPEINWRSLLLQCDTQAVGSVAGQART